MGGQYHVQGGDRAGCTQHRNRTRKSTAKKSALNLRVGGSARAVVFFDVCDVLRDIADVVVTNACGEKTRRNAVLLLIILLKR